MTTAALTGSGHGSSRDLVWARQLLWQREASTVVSDVTAASSVTAASARNFDLVTTATKKGAAGNSW